MIGLMIPNAFSVTSQECSQTVTSSGNSNPDCLDPSKIEKPKSAMTELGDFTYVEKSNYYGYAGVFKFLDWGMIPATDGNYKILIIHGEITTNTDSMKKGEGLITTPEDNFAIYNYGERSSLNISLIEGDNTYSKARNVDYDWKSDFTTPIAFFLYAEMYPETHYTNPLQLYYSPVIYGTAYTSKNIHLDDLANLPYLELCHDVSKAKICGLDISLKDIRIEEGNQKDLLIVEFNNELNQPLRQITTESGSSSKDYSHAVYPYSCPFGIPSNPFEIPQKCDMNGETKVKNSEWTFWEECLSSNTKKQCFVIEKSDYSFSTASFSSVYQIENYDGIFSMETDRESIKKSITKPSPQSSSTNENIKSTPELPSTDNLTKIDISNLKTYENSEFNFSMNIPKDWNVDMDSLENTVHIYNDEISLLLSTNEGKQYFKQDKKSAEEFLEKFVDINKNNRENVSIIDSQVVDFGDWNMYMNIFNHDLTYSTGETQQISTVSSVIEANGATWFIDVNLEPNLFIENSKELATIIGSFKPLVLETSRIAIPSSNDNIEIFENYQDWEIDMGITIDLPQEWDTIYYPSTKDDYATVVSTLYGTNGDVDAEITIFYYDDGVSYSDLSDKEKLKEIMKLEEEFDKEMYYTSTEFIDTSITKEGETSTFFLEFDSFDDVDPYYNTITQMFEVHSDNGVWGIYLDTFKQSDFGYAEKNIQIFESLKKSFKIIDDESLNTTVQDVSVPTWIKNNAGWWAEGQIDDNSFVQGIQFMIKENIISIPNLPESSSETADSVPAWVKNNAGWWAEGQIDDKSFVQGIEYLVKVGIIQVS